MEFDPGFSPRSFPKAFITLADVLGLFYIFQQKKTAHGAASVGLSWSVTESCTRRFFPMVFSAQSIQFTWDHSIAALEANVGIATHMCFAVLVWMYMRKPHMRHTIAVTIIVQRFAFPIVSRYDSPTLPHDPAPPAHLFPTLSCITVTPLAMRSYLAASLPELPFVAVSAQFGMSLVLAYATRAMLSANDQTRS